MDFNLSEVQAKHMLSAIKCAGFNIYGAGNFDISDDEKVELLIASFHKNRFKKCEELYERLFKKYMRWLNEAWKFLASK